MKWAVLLVLVTACWNDEPGIHLEVRPGTTGAQSVELYLATRPCAGCDNRLMSKDTRRKLAGEVWFLDGNQQTRTPDTRRDVTSGHAVFDLHAPDPAQDAKVHFVVAVGYGADGSVVGIAKLTDVTIPHDSAEAWRVTLAAAVDQPSSDLPGEQGERVSVWRRSDPATAELAACVGLEHSDGKKVERLWLVPEDDTDCDGIDLECDRYAWYAPGTTVAANASCVTGMFKPPTITDYTCLLGGQACVDGHAGMSCGPIEPAYCMSDSLCTIASCLGAFIPCVNNNLTANLLVTMPADAGLSPCPGDPALVTVRIDLSPMFTDGLQPSLTSCSSIKFSDLSVAGLDPQDDFMIDSAVFRHGPLMAPCSFDFTWVDGAVPQAEVFTMLDITLANGLHTLLPMKIKTLDQSCALAATAYILKLPAGDGISNCAHVPNKTGP